MTRAISPRVDGRDLRSLTRILTRIRSSTRRSRALTDQMVAHASALVRLMGGPTRMMVRTWTGYSPAADLKDHYELSRVLARLRNTAGLYDPALHRELIHHATSLLKLFAEDETLGLVDPDLEAETERREHRRRVQEEAIEESEGRVGTDG